MQNVHTLTVQLLVAALALVAGQSGEQGLTGIADYTVVLLIETVPVTVLTLLERRVTQLRGTNGAVRSNVARVARARARCRVIGRKRTVPVTIQAIAILAAVTERTLAYGEL